MSNLNEWAKLHTEWFDDPDLIAASDECEAAFVMWPVLIAKAKAMSHASRNPDGAILVAPARLAFDARCGVDQVLAALDALQGVGKLRYTAEGAHKVSICLNGFAKWQAPRGSNKNKQQRKNAGNTAKNAESDTNATPPGDTLTPNRPLEGEGEGEGDKKEPMSDKDPTNDEIQNVFEYWCKVERETGGLGSPPNGRRPRPTKDRIAKIRARLAEGYEPADLKMAIAFYARDPHHSGDNDRSTRFTDLITTLKTGAKVEAGIAGYANNRPGADGVSRESAALLQSLGYTPESAA